MSRGPERPYVTLVETDRPLTEEHHDAVEILLIHTLRRYTGTLMDALRKSADTHAVLAAQQMMEKAYFTSLGGQLRLMGPGEVAASIGVTAQRLGVLRKRPDFPAPHSVLECGEIWLAQDIERYDRERNKTPGRPKKNREEEKT